MTDDESKEASTAEELMEAIRAERQERKEQVSFEWVETIRKAGELYREIEHIEAVAEEVELPVEETREALTVYRLIFEDPPEVASKSIDPSRAYFSQERSLDDQYNPEEYDEPAEEILREYVGQIYLDHDIDGLPVDDPPDEATPPRAIDIEDFGDMFSLSDDSVAALGAVSGITKAEKALFKSQIPTVFKVINSEDFLTPATRSILGFANQQEEMLEAVVPLTTTINPEKILSTIPTAALASEIAQDIQIPATVLADMAQIQSVSGTAFASGYPTPTSSEPVDTRTPSSTTTAEVESVDTEPVEEIAAADPELGFAETTIDGTLPYASQLGTDDAIEIPALVVQTILSGEETYQWFTDLSKEYQNGVVGAVWVPVSLSVYPPGVYFTPVAVPLIRRAIVDAGEQFVSD